MNFVKKVGTGKHLSEIFYRRVAMKFLISLAAVLLLYLPNAWADCKFDCQNDYESAVKSCKEQYNDPDDVDELQSCLDAAKGDYESCIDECEDSTLT